jgi:hypothetical protein
VIVYWVAVAAVLYSAGVPTPHWRGADQFKPVVLNQLTLPGRPGWSAPAMAAQPSTANLTGWVRSYRASSHVAASAGARRRQGGRMYVLQAQAAPCLDSCLCCTARRASLALVCRPLSLLSCVVHTAAHWVIPLPLPHPLPPYHAATTTPPQDLVDACTSSPDCYISYDWNHQLKYAFIYHLFGLLWANQFIVGFSSVVVAGAVGSYYWARGDRSR